MTRMYSPSSPVLSSLDHHILMQQHSSRSQCLKFRYFLLFIISTVCLALLSASLATHKWIVSKPIRTLKLNNQTYINSLMLIAQMDHNPTTHHPSPSRTVGHPNMAGQQAPLLMSISPTPQQQHHQTPLSISQNDSPVQSTHNTKFQGEIYFGLFKGVKVLNYGFGDRISPISVIAGFSNLTGNSVQQLPSNSHQTTSSSNSTGQQQPSIHQPYEIVGFRCWAATLGSVLLSLLFALLGSIFAIINFVMSPKAHLAGPFGLLVWNSIAAAGCLVAMICWLVEFMTRLQANVLTPDEVSNGWTSDKRTQFGYSYYLVVIAFTLHLVNVSIIWILQLELFSKSRNGSLTSSQAKSSKRLTRPVCEGLTMLY